MLAAMSNVLVLGATSAIAAHVARCYAARGDTLFLVGRNPDKLASLRDELGARVVGHLASDLDDLGGNAVRIDAAFACLGSVDVAVIAHGLLGDQQASEARWSDAEKILCTNLLSPISLLVPLANHLERAGRGHIAVLSSVAGDRGRPRNFTYGAAKAGLNVYLQGLRSRLWSAGVGVHTFKLGPVDTPMTVDHPKTRLFSRAEDVAREIVDGIDAGVAEAYVPGWWRPILGLVRVMPERLFQRVGALAGR
jgi:decaprenylphospho-beta-D-erythro-pentofuranosid-2-ulose 2-reductase